MSHELELSGPEVRSIHGIPTTTTTRTLVDLGSVVKLNRLQGALDSAVLRGKTSISYLERRLRDAGRCPRGAGRLMKLVELRKLGQRPTESELERVYHRRVTVRFGLPIPEFQFRVVDIDANFRIDFAYPSILLGVEVLGANPHQTPRVWQHDWERQNKLTNLGWDVLYFTWPEVTHRPAEVANQVRMAIKRRTKLFQRRLTTDSVVK